VVAPTTSEDEDDSFENDQGEDSSTSETEEVQTNSGEECGNLWNSASADVDESCEQDGGCMIGGFDFNTSCFWGRGLELSEFGHMPKRFRSSIFDILRVFSFHFL
jgi:hypothetical protein